MVVCCRSGGKTCRPIAASRKRLEKSGGGTVSRGPGSVESDLESLMCGVLDFLGTSFHKVGLALLLDFVKKNV